MTHFIVPYFINFKTFKIRVGTAYSSYMTPGEGKMIYTAGSTCGSEDCHREGTQGNRQGRGNVLCVVWVDDYLGINNCQKTSSHAGQNR